MLWIDEGGEGKIGSGGVEEVNTVGNRVELLSCGREVMQVKREKKKRKQSRREEEVVGDKEGKGKENI